MRRVFLFILLLSVASMAAACGTTNLGFTPAVVQGQYEIVASSNITPGAITLIEANFTQTSKILSAAKDSVVVIQATQSSGLPLTIDRFGGVCDNETSGNDSLQGIFSNATSLSLTLTENGLSGTGTIAGAVTVSPDGKQITGNYSSPTQCSYLPDNGNLTGASIKPFSGRYAGRISNTAGTTDLVIAMMNQTGFNLTMAGTDKGTPFTLTGTVVGASFDVSGSISGTSVRYVGLYNPAIDEFRVFDPIALTFLGVLQGGS